LGNLLTQQIPVSPAHPVKRHPLRLNTKVKQAADFVTGHDCDFL
jgi:hypothetical protein